jgi:FkbM family methyltransferase
MPEPYSVLKKNVGHMKDIYINQVAIMQDDSDNRHAIYLPNYTLLSGFFVDDKDMCLLEEITELSLQKSFEKKVVEVPTRRLDSYIEHNKSTIKKIDILKIDVEKSELEVLNSLNNMNNLSMIQYIICEIHYENYQEVKLWMIKNGFQEIYNSDVSIPKYLLKNEDVKFKRIHENNIYEKLYVVTGIFEFLH